MKSPSSDLSSVSYVHPHTTYIPSRMQYMLLSPDTNHLQVPILDTSCISRENAVELIPSRWGARLLITASRAGWMALH